MWIEPFFVFFKNNFLFVYVLLFFHRSKTHINANPAINAGEWKSFLLLNHR